MRELVIMESETYREMKRKAMRMDMLEAELKDMAKAVEILEAELKNIAKVAEILTEKKNKEKEETYHYIYVG